MKTRVELYQAALRPRRDHPTPRHLLLGAVVVLLLWGLAFAWQGLSNYRLAEQNRQLAQQLALARSGVEQLQQSLALLNRSQDDGQRQRLEQDIRARRQLLGVLSQDNLVSYAATLEDLARIPWPRVSLTGLQLRGQAMVLNGEAGDAAAVPAWILGFEQRESLARRSFDRLDIQRREPGLLRFTLNSEGAAP